MGGEGGVRGGGADGGMDREGQKGGVSGRKVSGIRPCVRRGGGGLVTLPMLPLFLLGPIQIS